MRPSRIASLFMVLLVASFTAQAQETPLEPVLSETNIRDFFEVLKDLNRWAAEHEQEFAKMSERWEARNIDDPNSFAEAMGALQHDSEAIHRDVQRIIERRSFDGPEHWGLVGQALFLSIANAKFEEQEPEMKKGLSEAMKRMQALGLSEEQQNAMREAVGEIEAAREQMGEGVHPADLRLVRRNLEWIDELVAEMEQFHGQHRSNQREGASSSMDAAAKGSGG